MSNRRTLIPLFVTLVIVLLSVAPRYSHAQRATPDPSSIQDYQKLLPPVSGGINYGPCKFETDDDINDRRTGNTDKIRQMLEYCPNATVNQVHPHCRTYWMRQAVELQRSGAGPMNHDCPFSLRGALLVDHFDSSTSNYNINGFNCGKLIDQSTGSTRAGFSAMDSPESEVVRNVSMNMGPRFTDDRRFWNKLTFYSPLEQNAGIMSQLIILGIGEVVYGLRIGELIEYGYPELPVNALELLRRQPTYYMHARQPQVVTRSIIGQVLHDLIESYSKWQYDNLAHCPYLCQSFDSSSRGYACRSK